MSTERVVERLSLLHFVLVRSRAHTIHYTVLHPKTTGIRGGGGTPFLEKARAGPGGGGGAPATTAPAMPETKVSLGVEWLAGSPSSFTSLPFSTPRAGCRAGGCFLPA